MLNIATYPNPVLRQTAKPIADFDDGLKTLTEDMAKIMHGDDGIGLAAPQVGLSKRIIVIGDHDDHKAYINPEITYTSKNTTVTEEGCLSLPKIFGLVKRPKKIHLKYQDLEGKTKKEKIKGFTATVIQHEIDHLNGILFIDKASEITQGQDILEELNKKQ
jgi:peptide deformylase